MDIQKQLGKRVRELRRRLGLTQQELADKCGRGFVLQRIGEIERGEANCTLQTVAAIARGLACEPAELFLFPASAIGKLAGLPDARLRSLWNAADAAKRQKIVRVLSELLE